MPNIRIRYSICQLSLFVALVLSVGASASAQDKSRFTGATPLQPGTTYAVGTTGGGAGARVQATSPAEKRVSVIVKFSDASLAAYKGGVTGLAPTSPAVTGAPSLDVDSSASRQYLSYLSQRQGAFVAAAATISGAEVRQRFDVVLGGVSMLVPESQLDAVRALPGVEAVYLDTLLQLDTNVSPQFIGAPTIWKDLGGQDDAGEGVVVGVLDSGIWPEHPSVADPDPAGNGYPAPPPTWKGTACEFGNTAYNPDDAPFSCNNKLIGANAFIETYKAVIEGGLLDTEFDSARDDNGHGTHTATTAAGNAGVDAEILGVHRGTISGIAPRAHVAAYKVCGDQGCFGSDSVAAVQQAILDGVDVINFSISAGGSPYADAVELAFLDAYAAGVFVAASAGNSGPAAETVDHRGPWVTTVAASLTNRHFLSDVTLKASDGATLKLIGASITDGIAVPTPVVQAKDFDPDGDNLCAEEFPSGTFSGQIVVCQVQAPPGRIEKGFNVLQGGASGMLIYNPTLQGIGTDNHHLPAVMLEVDKGEALLDFLESHSGVTATFPGGEAEKVKGDVMAAFSSRGGPGQTLGIGKPDVTAPGVQIVAGNTPLAATVAGGPEGELFQAIRGTSMSSPHVAGAAALVVDLHPDWTPGQVKSALMTSATTKVLKEDESTPANPFDFGAGRIDLREAGDVGITFDVSAEEYVALEDELWNANYPSIYLSALPGRITLERTAHSVLGKDRTYRLSAKSSRDLRVIVPDKLKVPKSGDASFEITIDGRNVPLGEVRHAAIVLQGNDQELHLPISIVRRQPAVTLEKSCNPLTFEEDETTTCTITATNTSFDPADVELIDKLPKELKLLPGSVTGATADKNGLKFAGTLAPVDPPTVDAVVAAGSTPFGYLPLSLLGVPPVGGVSDESITNFTFVDASFEFASEVYTSIGMVSNGYLVVGGGTGNDVDFMNQSLPNPTPPNNVLAAFWTDLNPEDGGAMRAAVLTDGTGKEWAVFDWEEVPNFGDHEPNSFQVWIGLNGVQDITYAFGPVSDGDGGFLTVGAENRFGNRGQNAFFNGTAPIEGTEVVITSMPGGPGETKVVTFKAKGDDEGRFQNCAELTSQLFQGINLACVNGRVTD
jgi:uncharacterized repeat protein (TIGR01451 family)